jgi:dCTP diphosphatase
MAINSFCKLKDEMRNFVGARDWQQFHTPRNLLMALSGESGELSEIFQWKGKTKAADVVNYPQKELIHIGEEISDVFIYNLRLSDLCGIDIVQAIAHVLRAKERTIETIDIIDFSSSYPDGVWADMHFAVVKNRVRQHETASMPPRQLVLRINSYVGSLCAVFAAYSEDDCDLNLPAFSSQHVLEIGVAMARIAIHLFALADMCGLDVGQCITDKLAKNNRKYPAHLAKGSSAKYTSYTSRLWVWPLSFSFSRVFGFSPLSLRGAAVLGSSMLAGLLLLSTAAEVWAISVIGGVPQGDIVSM